MQKRLRTGQRIDGPTKKRPYKVVVVVVFAGKIPEKVWSVAYTGLIPPKGQTDRQADTGRGRGHIPTETC